MISFSSPFPLYEQQAVQGWAVSSLDVHAALSADGSQSQMWPLGTRVLQK